MRSEITLQIILVEPLPGVVYGLQSGSGNNYETIQKQKSASGNLTFIGTVNVKGDPSKDELPKLTGSIVQGSGNNKFIYIDIGTYAGQSDTMWARRLKIPLSGITWKDVDTLSGKVMLQTRVPGIGKDGGPNCATVKPFAGWQLIQA